MQLCMKSWVLGKVSAHLEGDKEKKRKKASPLSSIMGACKDCFSSRIITR